MEDCNARLVGVGACNTEDPMTRIAVQMPAKVWVLHVCGNLQHRGIVMTGIIANAPGCSLTMEHVKRTLTNGWSGSPDENPNQPVHAVYEDNDAFVCGAGEAAFLTGEPNANSTTCPQCRAILGLDR